MPTLYLAWSLVYPGAEFNDIWGLKESCREPVLICQYGEQEKEFNYAYPACDHFVPLLPLDRRRMPLGEAQAWVKYSRDRDVYVLSGAVHRLRWLMFLACTRHDVSCKIFRRFIA